MPEQGSRVSGWVEGLYDRSRAQVHRILHHGELVAVGRTCGFFWVEECLKTSCFVVVLDSSPLSTSPQLFIKPGVWVICIYLVIAVVETADRSNVSNVCGICAISVFASTREESVNAVSSGSVFIVVDRSNGRIQHQVALERVVRAHRVEGYSRVGLVSFHQVSDGVLFGDAVQPVVSHQPRVRIHNPRKVCNTETSESVCLPPIAFCFPVVNVSFNIFFVCRPVEHVVV